MTGQPVATAASANAVTLVDPALSERVARQEGPGDIDSRLPEELFVYEVTRWVQRWFDAVAPEKAAASEPAIFLFCGDHRVEDVLPGSISEPGFRVAFDAVISGNVYCSALGMRGMRSRKVGFAQATDAMRACVSDDFKNLMAVIVIPQTRQALVRAAGKEPDECDLMEFGPPRTVRFTFAEMDQILDDFHRGWTQTSNGHCRIWAKASERRLKWGAEAQIQGNLMGYLKLVVRPEGTLIDQEVFTQCGRADIRITIWPTLSAAETCYLELKVLKKIHSEKRNEAWALSGIRQVVSYREADQAAGPSYLCCFDGRAKDLPLARVNTEALRQGVLSKRFFMKTLRDVTDH